MSMSIEEFLEALKETMSHEKVNSVGLAIDGIFWREPDSVISRYTGLSRKTLAVLRQGIQANNPGEDYFTL